MEDEYPDERRPRTWLWVLIGLLLAFVGGIAAMGYAVTHDPRAARALHLMPVVQAQAQQVQARQVAAVQQHQADVKQAADQARAHGHPDPQMTQRVSALEDKVDDIEAQANAATGDASRAEGLLVAFAARRALDRGIGLGYLEGLLRQRFGDSQPQAVATILSASHQPVTLADLQNGLDAIAPALSAGSASPQRSWWQSFRDELAGMVVVRRAGEASSQPSDRVARAQRMLEAGEVDKAMAEIIRLPDHKAAEAWIPKARRYLASRSALDQIETAALLDPDSAPQAPANASPPAGAAAPAGHPTAPMPQGPGPQRTEPP